MHVLKLVLQQVQTVKILPFYIVLFHNLYDAKKLHQADDTRNDGLSESSSFFKISKGVPMIQSQTNSVTYSTVLDHSRLYEFNDVKKGLLKSVRV